MLEKILYVTAGSIAGGLARFFLSGWMNRPGGGFFPWGTVAVNLLGCFLIGLLAALAESRFPFGSNGRLLLMTGFCGAFTTFSAFILETSGLASAGKPEIALLNVAVNLFVGYLLFCGGLWIGKSLPA